MFVPPRIKLDLTKTFIFHTVKLPKAAPLPPSLCCEAVSKCTRTALGAPAVSGDAHRRLYSLCRTCSLSQPLCSALLRWQIVKSTVDSSELKADGFPLTEASAPSLVRKTKAIPPKHRPFPPPTSLSLHSLFISLCGELKDGRLHVFSGRNWIF